ncbi:insulinase family protein [Gilvimarinus polysaccharolyticus]|uniref:insulinase family protein n=1 Tax=Gilvimarinus polysaccharolyticus TaxID=863921 RepID=UPI0006734317|nr:insulinase family protein [Gilvimarinus polysaccharolyticus]
MSTHQHPEFEHLRSKSLESLNLTIEEYRHRTTGAQHIHLASSNNENVFLVALRTVPQDSTGVAHILEHTALCGSQRYPVRDPFFMMTRRSLNTFMNAFTSSDWTAYPFASQNRKDFNNLLDVYLDAVFFANLDPLDFAQEGHRLEFAEANDASSELTYKGVVFNEMKGAMSSVPSQLWQKLASHLFPTSTYHYNSGGDPEHIPDLTYEGLQAFYKHHYHPSNAIFMTYGDIPAVEHQEKFHQQALAKFSALDNTIAVKPEKRMHAPIRVEDAYPLDASDAEAEVKDNKTHVVMGWLLGQATDLKTALEAHLLASILFDNSASPLTMALEQTELGQAPSPLCGLDDSQFEMSFVCGLEGCAGDSTRAVEQLILDTLTEVANNGVAHEQLESSLHQLELAQREVGGDGFPYGLQLIMTALTAATHRGDTVAQLDLESALAQVRKTVFEPDFIQRRVRQWLLENNHRVTLTLRPDAEMASRAKHAEQATLAAIKSQLTETERDAIITQASDLKARQEQTEDDSILPQVTLADIPADMHYTPGSDENVAGYNLRCYGAGTNGLLYQQVVIKLPELSEQQLQLLPIYAMALTEVGLGKLDYLAVQNLQAQRVGSLTATAAIRSTGNSPQDLDGYLILSAKALAKNAELTTELIHRTLSHARFDEHDRLRELVAQARARREQGVPGSGHALAMSAAAAGMSPGAKINHELGGLGGLTQLKALDDSLSEASNREAMAAALESIHALIKHAPRQFLLVGEDEQLPQYRQLLENYWPAATQNSFNPLSVPYTPHQVQEAWLTNTQVNFCAKAYPTVGSSHPDAAALTVLGGVLRNAYLHRAIRERGGAYGGGASQDNSNGVFRFYSYRDPRLTETLDDFDSALSWLQEQNIDPSEVEQSILGVISSIDKPASPAGEAKQTYQAELFGRNRELREQFRQRVLDVTCEDIKRVAALYLQPDNASIAVISNAANKDILVKLGLTIKSL